MPVTAAVGRPANTLARISSTASSERTRMTASGREPLAVSTRTSATRSRRWSGFCTRSTFWMRAYGM